MGTHKEYHRCGWWKALALDFYTLVPWGRPGYFSCIDSPLLELNWKRVFMYGIASFMDAQLALPEGPTQIKKCVSDSVGCKFAVND
jgi:hypothetical protein